MTRSVEHKEPSGERTADRAPAEGQHPKGDNLGARSHTEIEAERLRTALELIRGLSLRSDTHLGRTRLSGLDQGCIACICELALGTSVDSDCVDAGDFRRRLEQLVSPDHHKSDEDVSK